ncbi:hypothetical protein [Aneurinibacillus terranovensis]|uniref:hypothetical protein n=1 Tax=Aneurinibacillus terranovensis TaxID=278991 RepID=UPI0004166829|nr:hypothetical protein [Aneurinibacillus terranovensis]
MKEKVTGLITGMGAAGVTVVSSMAGYAGQASNLCTGTCGSCGMGCSIAGLAAAGFILFKGRKRITGRMKPKDADLCEDA